jgi:hypothetical protein
VDDADHVDDNDGSDDDVDADADVSDEDAGNDNFDDEVDGDAEDEGEEVCDIDADDDDVDKDGRAFSSCDLYASVGQRLGSRTGPGNTFCGNTNPAGPDIELEVSKQTMRASRAGREPSE